MSKWQILPEESIPFTSLAPSPTSRCKSLWTVITHARNFHLNPVLMFNWKFATKVKRLRHHSIHAKTRTDSVFVLLEKNLPCRSNRVHQSWMLSHCVNISRPYRWQDLATVFALQNEFPSKKTCQSTRISWYIIFIDKIQNGMSLLQWQKKTNEMKTCFCMNLWGTRDQLFTILLNIGEFVSGYLHQRSKSILLIFSLQTKVSNVHSLWTCLSSTTARTTPTSTSSAAPASASSTTTTSCSS